MDIQYLLLLQNFRNSIGGMLQPFMEAVSYSIISVWSFIFIATIYWCFNKSLGSQIMLNLNSGYVVNQLIKNTFCVYRPWVRDSRIIPAGDSITTSTGYSFPSGHTQMANSIFGTIALYYKKRKWLVSLCITFILLVMFSRNYLGVHTPQDVIVGLLLSSVVIYINAKIIKWIDKSKNNDLIAFFIWILICVIYIIYVQFKPYPIDYNADGSILVDPASMIIDCYAGAGCFIGFLVGWIIERRLINFKLPKNITSGFFRLIIGSTIIYLITIYTFSPIISLLGEKWGNFAYFAAIYFWITAGFPLFFNFVEKILNKNISK